MQTSKVLLALGGGGLDLNVGYAGEFHNDEALKQRPEGTAGRITDLASAPSRLAAIPESTNAAFEYSVAVDG